MANVAKMIVLIGVIYSSNKAWKNNSGFSSKTMEDPDIIISPLSVRQAGFQGFLFFAFHVVKGFTLR